ncbi:MAG: GNAT family N-acetyltransferase [Chitinispirillaceae bacterium]|nr:GNAT family N-acetyltransferase [Chitinispirillaceae bacterium]
MRPDDKHLLSIQIADLTDDVHCSYVIALVNEYRCDSMGGSLGAIAKESELELLHGLRNHPSSIVYFALLNGTVAGMAVCFTGFSTFRAKKLLNIHDLILYRDYRKKGIGTWFLKKIAEEVSNAGYCKLTLEVRTDNKFAKKAYRKVGFSPCADPMEFWVMEINSFDIGRRS